MKECHTLCVFVIVLQINHKRSLRKEVVLQLKATNL